MEINEELEIDQESEDIIENAEKIMKFNKVLETMKNIELIAEIPKEYFDFPIIKPLNNLSDSFISNYQDSANMSFQRKKASEEAMIKSYDVQLENRTILKSIDVKMLEITDLLSIMKANSEYQTEIIECIKEMLLFATAEDKDSLISKYDKVIERISKIKENTELVISLSKYALMFFTSKDGLL